MNGQKLLPEEPFVAINLRLARELGLEAAAVLQQLHFRLPWDVRTLLAAGSLPQAKVGTGYVGHRRAAPATCLLAVRSTQAANRHFEGSSRCLRNTDSLMSSRFKKRDGTARIFSQ